MRRRTLLISLVLLAAACGGTATKTTNAPVPSPTAAPAAGSESAEVPQGTASPTTPAPPETVEPEGPLAPDFTATLDNGAEFSLSAHGRPIYLIFWAEW